jgi:GTP diphosphokinase / guanosine-3',5'-bis(diphosphate) 3'-diphosphatase
VDAAAARRRHHADSAGAFVDAVKTDLLAERVLVFTPAGDVVNLPRGSTPLDFAYQVHTEIGHRCVGARVNGEIVPLAYALQTGDRVEVLTNRSQSYGPSPDWLQLATTRSARQKIRHWFRLRERAGLARGGPPDAGARAAPPPAAGGGEHDQGEARRRRAPAAEVGRGRRPAAGARGQARAGQAGDRPLAPARDERGGDPGPGAQPRSRKSVSGVFIENMDAPAKLAQCCAPCAATT